MEQLAKQDIEDIFALTSMQAGMLFHYLKDPGSDLYFEQLCLKMSGTIDIQIFEKAWNMVVETNEMLRTVFRWQKVKEPVQMVLKEHRPDLRYFDLTHPSRQGSGVEEITARDREEKFDLQQAAFRVSLCKSAEDKYAMIISSHHILYDGWSNGIILKEFFDAYHHLLNGKKMSKTGKTGFKEFVKYLRHRPGDDRERFWTNYLAGFDTRSELSVKKKSEGRRPGRGEAFDTYRIKFEDERSRRLAAFVGSQKVTLAALFYGAWAILLQRYNNSRDVMFGATISGRSVGLEGIEDMVGLFINTLPLRVQSRPDESIEHQLRSIEGTWQKMETYAHTPLVDIKEYSEIEGNKEPVDSLLVVENYPLDRRLTRPGQLSVDAYSLFERTHYDLTVGITAFNDFEFTFIYNKEAFDGETIVRLGRHYRLILESILRNPGANVSEVDMLSEEERRQILTGFNHTDDERPGSSTIHRLFAERAEKIPDRTAILYEDNQLSYRQLNKRAAHLAGEIGSRGVMADTPVTIMMERSLEMVLGILAILKAGAAYLPITPDCPPDRAAFMLQDSGVQLLFTRQAYKENISDIGDLEVLDPGDAGLYRKAGRHLDKRESRPRDLAYVMYTSGSTGRPKGVMVSHGSLVNVLSALQRRYPVETADTYLFKTAYGFDVSVTELFGWFWGGGRLVVLEKEGELDPRKIVEKIEMTAVTHINFVPSMFNAFVESLCSADVYRLSSLKYIFLAGEALLPESVHKFKRLKTKITLENLYGPTEATVYAAGFSLCHWGRPGPVPIGKPLANMKLYILDIDNRLQPIGVPGELCIAGVGLSRGYLNNPQLTAEKFVNLAAKIHEETRSSKKLHKTNTNTNTLYRSGDLARWLPDGNIEFLGRIDQQVKIRGFRIELGEIESQLLTHPQITAAVAAVREDQGELGDRYLCAYFTSSGEDSLEAAEIREYLSFRLPDYMIPLFFVQLAEIPLSASGKVNRQALPAPHMDGPGEEYTAPRHAVDKGLVEIWSELLGVARESIGIDGNFFKMGGHSLKAIKLMSRIHKAFNVRLPLSRLFKYPSIRGLADYIEEAGRERYASLEKAEKKEYYPLSSAQMRLYVLHESRDVAVTYNISLAFRLEGKLEISRMKRAFAVLALRHESLRTAVIVAAGRPVQRVCEDIDFELEYVDLTEAGEQPSSEVMTRDFIRPFDLSDPPLWRVGLVKLSAGEHLLLWDMHHIVADGSSISILLQELGQLYAGTKLPGLRFQYRDYVRWQTHFFKTRLFDRQEAYWLEQFADKIPRLHLPLDFERPEQQSFSGETLEFGLSPETAGKLAVVARQESTTAHMVFFALYGLLLSRYSRQDDIVVGSLVAGRNHPDLEHMVGMFANFLPLRLRVRGEWTFREFLGQVKKSIFGAYENQGYPFEKIPDLLAVPLDWSRNPLFDTMVIYHNELESNISLEWAGGVRLRHQRLNQETSRLDLLLDVFPGISGALNCLLEYNTRLFKRESMQDFIGHFLSLTDQVVKGPEQRLVDIDVFSPAEESKLKVKREPARSVSLAVSATFTAEPIEEYIRWWGRRFHLDIETQFAPYNQVFQQLLDEESLLSKNSGLNLLLVRFEDWLREADLPEQKAIEKLRQNFEYLVSILKNKQRTIPWFVGLLPVSTHLPLPAAVLNCLNGLTERWQQAAAAMTNVYAADFRQLGELYRIDEVFDPIADKEGHVPFGREFLAAVGTAAARRVCALYNPPFKVIALDCDNTLWHGICGEDGALGVRVGGPYIELQKFMLARYNEGFLLVLCSKNNEADVWEVFDKNSGMVLKQAHFVAWKVNWRPKSENLRELAEELNVGLDSFIFIDDSGVECGEVMTNAPEVLSLQLPEDASSIVRFLSHVWAFDKVAVTSEDRGRSRMVRAERRRQEERESVSLSDFLAGLELKVGLNEMKPGQVSRVSQLTQRTNQFNLSSRCRREEELLRLSEETGLRCWVVEVSDRFGDYGLVGVLLTRLNSESLLIDTLLLSCRVLGRGVEDAVLLGLRRYCEEQGLKFLSADYYATAKNRPVLDFMRRCFNKEAEIEGGIRFRQEVCGIADSLPFVAFYYLEEIDRAEAVDKAVDTGSPLPVAAVGEPAVGDGHWQIDGGQMERQFHGNQLLPLQNHTARLLLDLPTLRVDETPSVSAIYREPVGEIEGMLLRVWQSILKVEKIGMDTTFFELGGNSLKAVGLISEVHRQFNVELRLRDIFEHKTIAKLAAVIGKSERRVFSALKSAEKKECYRLSSAQKRIYVLHQMEPESTTYNVTQVVEIEGPLDRRKLEESFGRLIGRHQSLRTSFFILNDEPVQKIHSEIDFSIEYYDLVVDGIPLTVEGFRGDPGAVDPGMPHLNIVKNFGRAFDLSAVPLLRIGLIRIARKRHILMVDMHHIISDGLSHDIFVREAASLYAGEELPLLRLQYKDFSEWQADGGVKTAVQQQAYWLGVYDGEIPVLHLATDYKRPPIRSSAGKTMAMTVGREKLLALRDLAAEEGVTLYTVLLSIFYILLARLSGQEEIIVGTVVVGRRHPDLQGIVGMFANMLALRGWPAAEKTFDRFLGEVGQTTLTAFENQDYPFEDLVDKMSIFRDWSRNPIFDVVFVWQNFRPVAGEKLKLKIKPYWYADPTSKYDILFEIMEMAESLNLKMEYWPGLFKGETIEKYLGYYLRVIDQVVDNRHIRIKDVEILAPEELHSILARIEQGDRDLVMEFDIG